MDSRIATLKESLELSDKLDWNIQELEEVYNKSQYELFERVRKALKDLNDLMEQELKGEELALKNKWYSGIINNRKG